MLADMSPSLDPVEEALARYCAAAYDKNVEAFVSIFHEHTSGPIDHKTMSGMIKRGGNR
jgi:hypothetical protein